MDDLWNWVQRFVSSGLLPVVIVALTLWNLDKLLSSAGIKQLYGYISHAASSPSDSEGDREISSLLRQWFSPASGHWRFCRNVFVLTLASLAILLPIYVAKTPSMRQVLLTYGFFTQFVGNGMIVTLLVNGFTF